MPLSKDVSPTATFDRFERWFRERHNDKETQVLLDDLKRETKNPPVIDLEPRIDDGKRIGWKGEL